MSEVQRGQETAQLSLEIWSTATDVIWEKNISRNPCRWKFWLNPVPQGLQLSAETAPSTQSPRHQAARLHSCTLCPLPQLKQGCSKCATFSFNGSCLVQWTKLTVSDSHCDSQIACQLFVFLPSALMKSVNTIFQQSWTSSWIKLDRRMFTTLVTLKVQL